MNRNILILLDKTIFSIVFFLFVLASKLRPRRNVAYQLQLSGDEHFLVIRPGGLGDGIMSVPLLRSLRGNFPNGKITLLCVKKSKPALEHVPYYDKMLVIDNIAKLPGNILYLWKNRSDVVLDLEQFRKVTSIISYLSGDGIRIGFDTNSRRLLYTHFVTYPNEKYFESINMIRQLEVLGVFVSKKEAVDIRFPIPLEITRKTENILASARLHADREFLVAIFPGVLKSHHRWKMEEFAELINLILSSQENARIVLLGSSADIPDAEEVMRYTGRNEKIVNLVGRTGMLESLGILKMCKVLIACDGGAVYMGASMGCRTISLWGPGVMERFKPPGEDHVGVRKEYFCIPCVNYGRLGEFPPCPYNRRCLNDLTAYEVYEHYEKLKSGIIHN